jgi:hypothetical protein
MDYIFYQVAAINGYDSFGHYLRAGLLLNQCSSYNITPAPACSSKFGSNEATGASARAASAKGYVDDPRRSDDLRTLDAYLHGTTLNLVGGSSPGEQQGVAGAAGSGSAGAPGAPQDALLGYLLGGGG